VTEAGGSALTRSEPAAVDLTISPAAPLSVSPGQATTVTTQEANEGPGAVRHIRVKLTAPTGWQVTPASAAATSIAKGASATQTWTVTAPSAGTGTQAAALEATATYISDADGTTQRVTAQQQTPPATPPLPPPTVTGVTPASGGVGTVETLTGTNFGATQGSSYILLFVPGISWGAPYDGAKLDILSWSNTSISFALPAPSGPGGEYHIAAGETADAVVGVAGVSSNAEPITITSSVTTPPNAPVITSVSPASGAAGTTITVTGQNFGASQVSNLSDFLTLTDSSGATYGPPFGAAGSLDITNWTDTSISFALPSGAAAGAATISVTTNNFASNNGSLTITASSASAARSGERRA
jgi:alpha-galactosidase-like protein/IPT/TIG domain-containing protein